MKIVRRKFLFSFLNLAENFVHFYIQTNFNDVAVLQNSFVWRKIVHLLFVTRQTLPLVVPVRLKILQSRQIILHADQPGIAYTAMC